MNDVVEYSESNIHEILFNSGIDFTVLPEGCIALIISFTSPIDASRFALVSKIFQSAADSDEVWEGFLPSDYKEIIASSSEGVTNVLSSLPKKQLYLRLADSPLLIDGGTKSFAVEKWTGKKSYMLSAGSLSIVWGKDDRYWRWPSVQESRFQQVAELIRVCWLEIKGKIKTSMLSPNSTYAAYFVFKMNDASHGFEHLPINASVSITSGNLNTRRISLHIQRGLTRRNRSLDPTTFIDALLNMQQRTMLGKYDDCPNLRGDGWFEVEIGEFHIDDEEDGDVEMAMWEVEAGNWKYGLIVQGIEIRPKDVKF